MKNPWNTIIGKRKPVTLHDVRKNPYTSPSDGDGVGHDPMIAPDEQYLIFTSVDRKDSFGSGDLYYSLRNQDGTWSAARNMGSKFNTSSYEYCSYATPDGKYLFYSSDYDVKWISTRYFPWLGR